MKIINRVQIFSLAFFVCFIAPYAPLNAAAGSKNKAKRLKIDTSSSLEITSEEISFENLAALLQSPVVDSEDFVKKLENFLSISGNNLEMKPELGAILLNCAVIYGHEDLTELLLDKKAHIETQDKDGWNSLHYAAYQGYTDVATLLLDKKAHIEAKTHDFGWTPFFIAALAGNTDLIKLFIKYGAHKDSESIRGNTALSAILSNAIKGKQPQKEIFSLLLQAGADCNFYGKKEHTLLNLALDERGPDDYGRSGESELAVTKELLEEGANPEFQEEYTHGIGMVNIFCDSKEVARRRGDFEVVKLIEAEIERRATEPKASVQLSSMANMVYEECILDEQKILGERGLAEIIARYGQSSRNARLERYEKP